MVRFVGDEVTHKVNQIGREVLPRRGWNRSTARDAELD
jgi:hypothetical protein